jgi:hypothetical protein
MMVPSLWLVVEFLKYFLKIAVQASQCPGEESEFGLTRYVAFAP